MRTNAFESKEVYLHGFIGQGMVSTSGNVFYGADFNNISTELTEIGINANWRFNDQVRFAGQLLMRNAGDLDAGNHFNIDYLLSDITLHNTAESTTGIRLGRFKNPLGFYNATRDVPMTRSSIFLPQSIYFDRVRNAQLSSDGIELYHNLITNIGEFQLEWGVGTSKYLLDKTVEHTFLFGDQPGDVEPNGPHMVGRIMYEHGGDRLKLALSGFAGELGYDTNPTDILQSGDIELGMYVASFEYNYESIQLIGEYLLMESCYKNFNPLAYSGDTNWGQGWYLQSAWRFKDDWTLLIRYDQFSYDKSDKRGRDYEARTGLPSHLSYAKDWTFGLTWDINQDLTLRTEYHLIEGVAWLSTLENENFHTAEKYWDLFAVYMSWKF